MHAIKTSAETERTQRSNTAWLKNPLTMLHSMMLSECLGYWQLFIQIHMLKTIQANELRRQKETQDILDSLIAIAPPAPSTIASPLTAATWHALHPAYGPEWRPKTLRALKDAQNAHDYADLRQLMCTTLAANNDTAMIEVLQIACSELPEVIKTMHCALEDVVEDGRLEANESGLKLALPSSQGHLDGGGVQQPLADSGRGRSGPLATSLSKLGLMRSEDYRRERV